MLAGPSSSTNDAIARFDSTTGKIIQNSGITVDDGNNVVGVNSLSVGLVSLVQSASIYFEGSTNDTFETQLSVVDPTADRLLSLPNADWHRCNTRICCYTNCPTSNNRFTQLVSTI